MNNSPLVSIIIPAYNAEKYIKEAIESVLNQTYKNIELIVVDDGSNDRTGEIVKSFKEDRMKYIFQENRGVAAARNIGIKNSKGEYIAFLDADDFYLPEKIEKEVEFLKEHPEFDLVYCNMKHFYEERPEILYQHKGPFYSGNVFEKLLESFFGQLNTVLIPRKIFDKVGLFDESSLHSEEWDLHLRIARAGFKFGFLDEDLVRIRMKKDSLSRFENQWQMKEHNLLVFERLFQSMKPEEREYYKTNKILKRLRLKLAIAYLAAGDKNNFYKTLQSVDVGILQKLFLNLFVAIVFLIPIFLIKFIIIKLWEQKQKRLFIRIG